MRMLVSPPKHPAGPLLLLEGRLGVRALCKWSHGRLDTSPDLHSSSVLFLCPVCILLLRLKRRLAPQRFWIGFKANS